MAKVADVICQKKFGPFVFRCDHDYVTVLFAFPRASVLSYGDDMGVFFGVIFRRGPQ